MARPERAEKQEQNLGPRVKGEHILSLPFLGEEATLDMLLPSQMHLPSAHSLSEQWLTSAEKQLPAASPCGCPHSPTIESPAMAAVLLLSSRIYLCVTAATLSSGGSTCPPPIYPEEAAKDAAERMSVEVRKLGHATTLSVPGRCFSFQGNEELSLLLPPSSLGTVILKLEHASESSWA